MRGSVKRRGDSWRARYRGDDGKDRQRTFAHRRDADRWVREQLNALGSGTWVDPSAGSVRFAEFAAQWLASQHVRPSTHELSERRIRRHLSPVLGELQVRQIRRSHVVAMVHHCTHELRLSPRVTRFALTTLRSILDAAVADKMIPLNVAADKTIALPRAQREAVVALTFEEISAIAAAIDPRLRAMVLLGAATGLRSGELRGLTIDRISPPVHLGAVREIGSIDPISSASPSPHRRATIRVDRQWTRQGQLGPVKTDSSVRDVSIGATTVALLREHLQRFGVGEGGFVFTSASGVPVASSVLSIAWTTALREAGVRAGPSVHDLRHHHASQLLSEGVSPALVGRRLGHANPSITLRIYAHVMPNDDERALAVAETIASRLA